jgi:hypothetical protein
LKTALDIKKSKENTVSSSGKIQDAIFDDILISQYPKLKKEIKSLKEINDKMRSALQIISTEAHFINGKKNKTISAKIAEKVLKKVL